MKTYYKINSTGNARNRRFSIDRVTETGQYINQEAFFFDTRAAAQTRLDQIITEDKAAGRASEQFLPPSVKISG